MSTADEIVEQVLAGLLKLDARDAAVDCFGPYLYKPRPEIRKCLDEIEEFVRLARPTTEQAQHIGYKLEELVVFAFSSLRGWNEILSWESAGPQIDLEIVGNGPRWETLSKHLLMNNGGNAILVEAKAKKKPVTESDFARFCAILDHNCSQTVGLGVFVTLRGATGFPKRGVIRKKLGDAWLRQALFHARTRKPVVVLDIEDLRQLPLDGALPRILRAKIFDVERLGGLSTSAGVGATRVDLPPRLRAALEPEPGAK
ncbi:MAG: hypothetical protein ACOY0T_35660 [Myxococcota bacterium]